MLLPAPAAFWTFGLLTRPAAAAFACFSASARGSSRTSSYSAFRLYDVPIVGSSAESCPYSEPKSSRVRFLEDSRACAGVVGGGRTSILLRRTLGNTRTQLQNTAASRCLVRSSLVVACSERKGTATWKLFLRRLLRGDGQRTFFVQASGFLKRSWSHHLTSSPFMRQLVRARVCHCPWHMIRDVRELIKDPSERGRVLTECTSTPPTSTTTDLVTFTVH